MAGSPYVKFDPQDQRRSYRGLGILLRLAVLYAILIVIVYFIQDLLLYHPYKLAPSRALSEAKSLGLRLWPPGSTSDSYKALVADRQPPQPHRGTVIVVHGNAGRAAWRAHYVEALQPLGFRVILLEYPGYGARLGRPGEATLAEAVREVVREAAKTGARPIYLLGESMGAAVAASAVRDGTLPVDGLILHLPWNNLPDLAQSIYWYLPARFMVRDRYDSATNLSGFRQPVVVTLAERDEVVPFSHGLALYETLRAPKKKIVFNGATHNSWPGEPGSSWFAEALDFLDSMRVPHDTEEEPAPRAQPVTPESP